MQDIGSQEDTELKSEDVSSSSRLLPVESLGHCQSIGNWMFFLRGFTKTENQSLFSSFEGQSVGAPSAAQSFAEALNHSAGPGESLQKLYPKKPCHLRGSPQNLGTSWEQRLPNTV
jgi:hypothetical protein